MTTRARIGIRNDDGTVTSMYVHRDGYPDWVGIMLKDHYNTRELVKELVEIGALSELEHTLKASTGYGSESLPKVIHPIDSWPKSGHSYEYLFIPEDGRWRYRDNTCPDWLYLNSSRPAGTPPQMKWVTEAAVYGSEDETRLQNEGWEPFAAAPCFEPTILYRRQVEKC